MSLVKSFSIQGDSVVTFLLIAVVNRSCNNINEGNLAISKIKVGNLIKFSLTAELVRVVNFTCNNIWNKFKDSVKKKVQYCGSCLLWHLMGKCEVRVIVVVATVH